MKKITLIAAFLGSVYFANAQVGIGTPEPSTSSMLDIVSDDKGVLIPRVRLANSITPLATGVGQEESLLVYNIISAGTGDEAVSPGFYYWISQNGSVPAHWERVINQAQLDDVLTTQSGDLSKVKALLAAAYGSNNLNDQVTNAPYGGMVFTPAAGSDPAKFEYIRWNTTSNAYDKVDITAAIAGLINANESKTSIIQYPANSGKFYYISEETIHQNNQVVPTSPFVQVGGSDSAALLSGVVVVDVPNSVAHNFQTILEGTTTILKPNQTTEYYTVEEYIQNLIDSASIQDNVMTYVPGSGLNAAAFTYTPAGGTLTTVTFSNIVKANESVTQVVKNETGTALAGNVAITYAYFNEAQPDNSGVPQATVDLTTDLRTLIQGNTDIKNAIQNVLNQGGNVYFTTTAIAAGTPQNQLAIPANSFYTVNQDGVKIEITVPVNISQLITAIKNATTEQKNDIKLQLGDNFATNNTSVFTGDTVTIGGTTLYVYRGIFTTTVNANTANTTGIVLDKAPSRILSMNLRYAGGLVANTTDLTITTNTVSFRIGTGKMYQVLGTANVSGDVTVEFASTVVPAGIN